MTWTKLDDGFTHHPKVRAVGLMAELLQIHALVYCNRYLTDGLVPIAAVSSLGVPRFGPLVTRLLSHGLWHDQYATCDSKNCPLSTQRLPGQHYAIHDFFEYQRSRAVVVAERERNAKRKADSRGSHGVTTPETSPVTASGTTPVSPIAPSRPVLLNASSVGSLEPDKGIELAVEIADVLGVATMTPLEIQACEQATVEFAYLTVPDLVQRAKDHQEACRLKNWPVARSVQGLWEAWRTENEHRADHGGLKPRTQTSSGMQKAFNS